MVMNFVECEINREYPFKQPAEKSFKDYSEIVRFKDNVSSSDANDDDSSLSKDILRTSNKLKDSKTNNSLSKEFEQAQILIAEPEPDILSLFKAFLETVGIKSATVADSESALDVFLEKENKGRPYDVIVLDTHLKGLGGLGLAKMIHDLRPTQRIIMVTTTPTEYLPKNILKSAMIGEEDILTMPFKLSDFLSRF